MWIFGKKKYLNIGYPTSKIMISNSALIVFLLLATSSTFAGAHPCHCTVHPTKGLQVNCNFGKPNLRPHLPQDTAELHLYNISMVQPGLFDKLVGLKTISFIGNSFHCDCRTQYLRNWLWKNKDIVLKEPKCTSPTTVAKTPISDLGDDFFSTCSPSKCTSGAYIIIIGMALSCVIVLLVCSLILAKKSTITLYIDERHALFEAHSLRSRKPKHRRWSFLNKTEPLERPLLNMELLPQVLDTLHKKHNIKIKQT